MNALTQLQRSRCAFDYRIATALQSPMLSSVTAYRDALSADRGLAVSAAEGEGGLATVYRVQYDLESLSGPNTRFRGLLVDFQLLSGGNYPWTEPYVTVLSRPTPWSPHFLGSAGTVCIGEGWRQSKGKMLLAQLITHVARLANFDEPDRGREYVGWNPPAATYWRTVMGARPLTPGLPYPVLPPAAYGVTEEASSFREAAATASGEPTFRSFSSLFRPTGGAL